MPHGFSLLLLAPKPYKPHVLGDNSCFFLSSEHLQCKSLNWHPSEADLIIQPTPLSRSQLTWGRLWWSTVFSLLLKTGSSDFRPTWAARVNNAVLVKGIFHSWACLPLPQEPLGLCCLSVPPEIGILALDWVQVYNSSPCSSQSGR